MNLEATLIPISLPKPWPNFLTGIDAALPRTVNLHCIGGFVLILYGIPRSTGDLDYTEVVPRDAAAEVEAIGGKGSALNKKYRLFLQSVGVHDLPDGYESRLLELRSNLQKLKLSTLEPYDLLLSKLPRNSPKDQEDAKYLIRKLNLQFEIFNSRWTKEMAHWIANRERHELTIKLWAEYFPKPSKATSES